MNLPICKKQIPYRETNCEISEVDTDALSQEEVYCSVYHWDFLAKNDKLGTVRVYSF